MGMIEGGAAGASCGECTARLPPCVGPSFSQIKFQECKAEALVALLVALLPVSHPCLPYIKRETHRERRVDRDA